MVHNKKSSSLNLQNETQETQDGSLTDLGIQNFLQAIVDPKTPLEFIQAMTNPNSPFFKQLMNELILLVINTVIIKLEIYKFTQEFLILEAKEKLEINYHEARYSEEKKRFQQMEEQQTQLILEANLQGIKNTENIGELFQLKEEIVSQNIQLTQEIATLQENIESLEKKQPAIEKICNTVKEERINHIVESLVNEKFINAKGEEIKFDEMHVEKLRPHIKVPTPFEHAKYNPGLIDKIIDSISESVPRNKKEIPIPQKAAQDHSLTNQEKSFVEEKQVLSSQLLNEVINNGANVSNQLTILARGEKPDGPPLGHSQLLMTLKMNKKLQIPARTPAEQEASLAASRLLTEKRMAERQLKQKLITQSDNTQLLATIENTIKEKQENKDTPPSLTR